MLKKSPSPPKNRSPVNRHSPPIFSESGWIAEGLLAAFFVGMVLFILLFTWVSANNPMASYPLLRNIGIAAVIFIAMISVYWWVGRYRKKRFSAGKIDPLFMRQLVVSCLEEDCGEIKKLFSANNLSDVDIFIRLVTAKLQHVLDHEGLRKQDLQNDFRESRIAPIKNTRLYRFFSSPLEFDQMFLPSDLAIVYKALAPICSNLKAPLKHLKNIRQSLFTCMSDYLALWHITDKDVEKLQQTYRYSPPDYELAQKLAFANKIIRFLKRERQGGLPPSQQYFLEKNARQKVSQLKSVLQEYEVAWKDLVKAYEALSFNGHFRK